MKKYKILVTGIGGNVGQGILRNIKHIDPNIFVVGTNVVKFSAGNHLCDKFYKTSYAYDSNYILEINRIVEIEGIDLIIPSTDYEAHFLSFNKSRIASQIAVSHHRTTEIYLNKYKTYLHHKKFNIPFAESILPSEYDGRFAEIILKPKEGRGSRGIYVNPKSLGSFSDKEYMVQDLIRGVEITTAFYVTKNNKLHGLISLERELVNGTTNLCKVVDVYDSQIRLILEKMIFNSSLRGAINLQSIITKDNKVIPFEINCRISGTNSIRSNFGFEDVRYTLEEYLFNKKLSTSKVKSGVAVRILMDVIYPEANSIENLTNNSIKHYIF
jgi:carbamoyl-phosphate synthase large subunit